MISNYRQTKKQQNRESPLVKSKYWDICVYVSQFMLQIVGLVQSKTVLTIKQSIGDFWCQGIGCLDVCEISVALQAFYKAGK